MNINYGLLPPLTGDAPRRGEDGKKFTPTERSRAKKRLMSLRALEALDGWLSTRKAAA